MKNLTLLLFYIAAVATVLSMFTGCASAPSEYRQGCIDGAYVVLSESKLGESYKNNPEELESYIDKYLCISLESQRAEQKLSHMESHK